MVNDDQGQSGTESPIGELELEAIRLKFEGYNYPEIASRLQISLGRTVSDKTIKNWFYRSGKLYDFYNDYALKEAEIRRSTSLDLFRAHLDDAVRTLFTLMGKSKSDMIRLLAAKEIINRQLGEPKKVVAVEPNDPVQRLLDGIKIFEDDSNNKETQSKETV